MKNQKIKNHMNDYYQSKSLDDDKIQLLMDISTQYAQKRELDNKKDRFSLIGHFLNQQKMALVASVMLLVMSFWGVNNFEQNEQLKNNFSQLVAQEIALNHNKQLTLDFNEVKYSRLNKLMHKLDFQITESQHINLAGLEVVGARYCSIQGNIAAQIRLRDDAGKVYTLYQTKLTDLLKKSPANIQSVDQIDVKQWQENNVFFGLAVSLPSVS